MKRVLALRLQAIGDALIPIKLLAELGLSDPDVQVDYLVPAEVAELAESVRGIRRVIAANVARRRSPGQALALLRLLPRLRAGRYDVVLDLQNNRASRLLAFGLQAATTISFDRYSPRPHGERVLEAIRCAGFDRQRSLQAAPTPATFWEHVAKHVNSRAEVLSPWGLAPHETVIAINPAGAFASRHWPVSFYAELAEQLRAAFGANLRLLFMGVAQRAARMQAVRQAMGAATVDLVGKTSLLQAQRLLAIADGMVSEDSGLMHLGWLSGTPTVALMGASPSFWSRPLGDHTACLDSANLACAWCGAETCPLGHQLCLTQYQPQRVAETLLALMSKRKTPE